MASITEECAFSSCEHIYEYETGGCPCQSNKPSECESEDDYMITWVSSCVNCGSDPRYQCQNVRYELINCWDESQVWQAIVDQCEQIDPPENCTPTGHGEGTEGFEAECYDFYAGEPLDNDCDGLANCQEPRCGVVPECAEECDIDSDGRKDTNCGGPDCHPNDPNLPSATEDCYSAEDDDCDGKENCRDSDCNTNADACPQCDADLDGIPSEPDCDGTDCFPSDPSRPQGQLNGTTWKETACNDGLSNDCDADVDCADSDCVRPGQCGCEAAETNCAPESGDEDCDGSPNCLDGDCAGSCDGGGEDPTPTPEDPCQGDECCGRGTHQECTEGECEPAVEVCADWDYDPYTQRWVGVNCVTYPPVCEPESCVEVCN